MKKILAIVLFSAALAAQASSPNSNDDVKGTLTKIDGAFYVVKDPEGAEHRLHFDATTQKKGEVKEGDKVELHVKDGHVIMIEAHK